jgi:sterol desaturase/sphingolipid hydroxylase (fatty acid hydroxylase superfamily)
VPTLLELFLDPVSLALFGLYLSLMLWEALLPARRLPRVAGWWWRGTLSFLLYFVVSSYLPLALGESLAGFRLFDASSLGTVPGALLATLCYELLGYTWHRAMHGSNALFRSVHQMHHSAERLDVPSAFWFSPLDMIGWTLVSTLALSLIGLSPAATTLFVLFGALLGVLQHANVRTPRWLGYFVQRPESHSYHHARGIHAGNYANLPVFDMLFGTFHNPQGFAEQAGFRDGASRRIADMLVFRDVSRASSGF